MGRRDVVGFDLQWYSGSSSGLAGCFPFLWFAGCGDRIAFNVGSTGPLENNMNPEEREMMRLCPIGTTTSGVILTVRYCTVSWGKGLSSTMSHNLILSEPFSRQLDQLQKRIVCSHHFSHGVGVSLAVLYY